MTAEGAKLNTVEAANAMENIVVPKSRIKLVCSKKTAPQNDAEQGILGYFTAYETVVESFDSMPVRMRYIQQLHRELYPHVRSGGNFKKTHESITATDSLGNEIVLFTPMTPYETPGAIDEICNKYNRAESDAVTDPLLLIPIFVLDFLSIRPFSEGNERVASLLTLLLLLRSGYTIGKYVSIDKLIAEARPQYYNALRTSQLGWNEGREDVTPFVKFFLTVLRDAYREFEDRIDIFGEKQSAFEIVRNAAHRTRSFTKAEMQQLCPTIGKTSVESSLRKLVELRELTKEGSGRATFYKVR